MKQKFFVLLSIFVLAGLAVGSMAYAGSANAPTFNIGGNAPSGPSEGPCAGANTIGVCIVNIYTWSLGIAVLLALIMIVVSGYLYMTAGGNAQAVASAKELFTGAIIGLIILFGAVLILRTINPDLVYFNGSGGNIPPAGNGTGNFPTGNTPQGNAPGNTPPTVTAGITSEPLVVSKLGDSVTVKWFSTDATSCTASGDWAQTGDKPLNGSESSGPINAPKTFTITCTGPNGTVTDSHTVNTPNAPTPPPKPDIKADGQDGPITVPSGTSVAISWTTADATTGTTCSVTPGGWTGVTGSQNSANLTDTATFIISCDNGALNGQDSVTINIQAPPPVSQPDIKADGQDGPITITQGTAATISWTTTNPNGATCSVTPTGWTGVTGSQSTGPMNESQTYVITCDNGSGASASDSVTVNISFTAPTVSLSATRTNILAGESTELVWSTTGTITSCTASLDWSGAKSIPSGNQSTGVLTSTKTYILTCTGPGGTKSASVVVNVTAPKPTVTLTANPTVVSMNGTSQLIWSSTNATSCTASGNWSGGRGVSGSETTAPILAAGTYTIVCSGPGGNSDPRTVNVVVTGWEMPGPTACDSAQVNVSAYGVGQHVTYPISKESGNNTFSYGASNSGFVIGSGNMLYMNIYTLFTPTSPNAQIKVLGLDNLCGLVYGFGPIFFNINDGSNVVTYNKDTFGVTVNGQGSSVVPQSVIRYVWIEVWDGNSNGKASYSALVDITKF